MLPENSGGSTGEGARGRSPPPRLGQKKFIARPKTHICKPPFACQNVLKLTYSNLEFQNFLGEDPLFKGRGGRGREEREGKGKGRKEGKDRERREGREGTGEEGGREGRNGGGRGGALDIGSAP